MHWTMSLINQCTGRQGITFFTYFTCFLAGFEYIYHIYLEKVQNRAFMKDLTHFSMRILSR